MTADRHSKDARVAEGLEHARDCYARRAWAAAYDGFAGLHARDVLTAADLERLATSAYLIGRDGEYLAALERAYQVHCDTSDAEAAARCAFWLGLRLLFRGEFGHASGWFARAQRLIESRGGDSVVGGYLRLNDVDAPLRTGDCEGAYAAAADAAAIGERFREHDLVALARYLQGRARVQQGRVGEGMALLDETMLTVSSGDLSPIVTGLVYCAVIEVCQEAYALARSREWTFALAQWCEAQPEMVAFTGTCRVHRAEILQWHGAWGDAVEEARAAAERCAGVNRRAAAAAYYQEGEILRLQGRCAEAEEAYRNASERGCEPQPGLALLRLAQGRTDTAAATIRRAVDAAIDPRERARLLPAKIDILLAAGDVTDARAASEELTRIATGLGIEVLVTLAAEARGAVRIAEGLPQAALVDLRQASESWQRMEAPHRAACARVLVGLACRALGDDDGAQFELAAARTAFERLGAATDLARLDALRVEPTGTERRPLTAREIEVLRLVATGRTNKLIARELSLSEKTIDRHLCNIFAKLDVCSRTAATAYAYEHHLI